MKKYFLLVTLMCSVNTFSQVSFIGPKTTKDETATQVFVYDSLENIKSAIYKDKKSSEQVDHFGHLIGQTFIYVGKYCHDGKDHNLRYEVTQGKGKRAYTTTEVAKAPEIGTEFTVIGVTPEKTSLSLYQNIIIQENLTGQKYIYEPGLGDNPVEWVVKGYYEKMKELYVGKQFYYINAFPSYETDYYMRNLDTDEMQGTIEDFSKWRCIDVSIKIPRLDTYANDEKSRVVLVFENEEGEKCYSFTEKSIKKPMTISLDRERQFYGSGTNLRFVDVLSDEFSNNIKYQLLYADIDESKILLGKFLNEEQYKKISESLSKVEEMRAEKVAAAEKANEDAKKRAAARKSNLIKKYGESVANDILKGYVRIGWTKEMCIEAWGRPKDINKTSGSYGVHEQWVYGGGNYLYFENGKLTTIQN